MKTPPVFLVQCLQKVPLWLLAAVALSTGAQAQSTKIFVASFGNDANDGSRGSPKRNFQAAHDAVAAGGEIVALDTAGYGPVSIVQAIGITVPPGVTGFVTVTSGNAISINTTGTVTLRGLTLNSPGGGFAAINVSDVGTLEVSNCVISGFSDAIDIDPASSPTVVVKESTIRDSSNGILVPNFATVAVKLVIDGCRLQSNTTALNLATNSLSHRAEIHNTLFSGNSSVAVRVNGGSNRVSLDGCVLSNNGTAISLLASGASAKVSDCLITGNTTGLNRTLGAVLLSRSNNTLENNGTDGTFSSTYTAK